MKNNKYWGRKYSAREVSEAKVREAIIISWQAGKRLAELIKDSGIAISRQAWSLAREKYEKHGLAGLLDRRGMKGGRKPKIDSKGLDKLKNLVSEDISSKELEQTTQKELGVKFSIRQGQRLLRDIGIIRKGGRPRGLAIIDKQKGVSIDNAGVFFLKGADTDMEGAKTIVEEIISGRQKDIKEKNALKRLRRSMQETIRKKVETLLYLPMYEMQKPYHLLKYHKRGLGLLTGSGQRYNYFTADIFLCDIEKLRIAKSVGDKLVRCYLEALCIEIELEDGSCFYIDGHSKHVWSDSNIPKAFFTTLKRAERGLHQYFIHSNKGNPLILLTCPGDTRLTGVLFNLIDAFENAAGKKIVKAAVFDREGLSLSLFREFANRQKYFITLLREDMYKGEGSFKRIKDYVPLKVEKKGDEINVLSWVADAEYELKEKKKKEKEKDEKEEESRVLRAALIRKIVGDRIKLIAIITNITREQEPDIREIVRMYFKRWPNEEKMFRDAIEAIKVDTNHGYKKDVVPNRVVARKQAELEQNLRGISTKLGVAVREREQAAGQLQNLEQIYKTEKSLLQKDKSELYAKIKLAEQSIQRQSQLKDLRDIENKLTRISEQYGRQLSELKAILKNKVKYEKGLRTQQKNKENEIKSLDLEKVLYDMDREKDHLMSNFKMLLINLSSYAQRQYFPKEVHNFTLKSMKRAFYQQDGYVKIRKRQIDVTLHSYDEPDLQKAVEYACMKFNNSGLSTADGQRILMHVEK
ncbi:MAG: hypothetical protein KAX15_05645 [Candidatus Omnitrophica bacterium]|nr:hypothetical protein [Candidatus Omnitrophota bacterium]